MPVKLCGLAASIILACSVASAQVALETKYTEGTRFTMQVEDQGMYALTLGGMNFDSKTSVFSVKTTTIGRRAANGSLELEEKVNTLQAEISLAGGIALRFDSAVPDKKADIPQLEFILDDYRAQCLPVTVELDSQNKIARATLPSGEFENLSDSVKDRFKPASMKKAFERSHVFLPDAPVNLGDSWERSTETYLGDGHVLTLQTKYEYAGTVVQDGVTLDKIVGKPFEASYAVSPSSTTQLMANSMKVIDAETAHFFDRKLGMIVSYTTKVRISGPVSLVNNGVQLDGNMDLTIEEKATRQK